MEYPVWHLAALGGGFWVALIATVHVYVAHFAVGGGLFLILAERKGYRDNSPAILEFTKKHARFFMLLTMVFGGLTGVAIWFIIALLSPQATSSLIHTFVFGWATEWVCFLGEIIALLVYYYSFGKMNRRDHMRVGWAYFIFAWLSLFIIGGIISFMLTPGKWLETGNYLDGFFNPTLWPSVALRTFMSFAAAGLFGFFTATRIKDEAARNAMSRSCAAWTIIPVALSFASAWWYLEALPPQIRQAITSKASFIFPSYQEFINIGLILLLGGLIMAARLKRARTVFAAALLFLGLLHLGAFEFIREGARKPFLIYNTLYSSHVLKKDVESLRKDGFLARAKWARIKEITPENRLRAGEELYYLQCSGCHSLGGPLHDILPATAKFTPEGMRAMLAGLGMVNTYMPPFAGNAAEREALADYLTTGLHGPLAEAPEFEPEQLETDIPAYNPHTAEYLLTAAPLRGMVEISDCSGVLDFAPPFADVVAQLVRRGDSPELVADGAEVEYAPQDGFQSPSARLPFWEFSKALTGQAMEPNTGPNGAAPAGTMPPDPEGRQFTVTGLPVTPYSEQGGFLPYPLFTFTAKSDGKTLVETRAVIPSTTELACKNCHGGPWRQDNVAGISDATARDILATHDRMSGTDHLEMLREGYPVNCRSCHEDGAGLSLPNLSAAVHGLHAVYLRDQGGEACLSCHPGGDTGATRFYRGLHAGMGLDCANCHGAMEDHALALLKREAGKPGAARLIPLIAPRSVTSLDEINPRTPWAQEPDCLTCHTEEYTTPETMEAFNVWTKDEAGLYSRRKDDMDAMRCVSCHGSPHTIRPAENPYGPDRDAVQPLEYQGENAVLGGGGRCASCHTVDMEFSGHHPNQLNEG